MSEPKRYELYVDASLQAEEGGEWVKYDDYADLKAQVERLTKAGDAMAIRLIRCEERFNGIESAEAQMWYIAKEGGCP
jgi:hypothetical protein